MKMTPSITILMTYTKENKVPKAQTFQEFNGIQPIKDKVWERVMSSVRQGGKPELTFKYLEYLFNDLFNDTKSESNGEDNA